jgi:hypothetical protein
MHKIEFDELELIPPQHFKLYRATKNIDLIRVLPVKASILSYHSGVFQKLRDHY